MNLNTINTEITDMTKQYLIYNLSITNLATECLPKQSENEDFKRLVRHVTREAGFKQGLDCLC